MQIPSTRLGLSSSSIINMSTSGSESEFISNVSRRRQMSGISSLENHEIFQDILLNALRRRAQRCRSSDTCKTSRRRIHHILSVHQSQYGWLDAFPFRCHCQTLTPPLLLQSSSNPLLALQTPPYPSSFKHSLTSLPSFSSSTRAPKTSRKPAQAYLCLRILPERTSLVGSCDVVQ